jgi:hypothetical protein
VGKIFYKCIASNGEYFQGGECFFRNINETSFLENIRLFGPPCNHYSHGTELHPDRKIKVLLLNYMHDSSDSFINFILKSSIYSTLYINMHLIIQLNFHRVSTKKCSSRLNLFLCNHFILCSGGNNIFGRQLTSLDAECSRTRQIYPRC